MLFVTTVQQMNTALVADLQVVGTDPIEDLRSVPELTAAIAGSCDAVERHLVQTIDAGCNGALDQAQRLSWTPEKTFQATPTGSPEETAAGEALFQAIDGAANGTRQLATCRASPRLRAERPSRPPRASSPPKTDIRPRPFDSPEETAAG